MEVRGGLDIVDILKRGGNILVYLKGVIIFRGLRGTSVCVDLRLWNIELRDMSGYGEVSIVNVRGDVKSMSIRRNTRFMRILGDLVVVIDRGNI